MYKIYRKYCSIRYFENDYVFLLLVLLNFASKIPSPTFTAKFNLTGQAEAIQLGVARLLCEMNKTNRVVLKPFGFLTRDSRIKERKKYGLRKARKAPQYSKR